MARKTADLTTRQRQSQRIMREKAARMRRQAAMQKLRLGAFVAVPVLAVAGVWWLWQSDVAGRAAAAVHDGVYALTSKAGFRVARLYLEGRDRTPLGEIERAVGVKKGDPILALPLEEMRRKLGALGTVRHVSIERELPGALYIRIVEREPAVRWQHDGRVSLLDESGVEMAGFDMEPYRDLPLVVGRGARERVGELLALLAAEPELAKRYKAAVYVGERRWNVRLKGDIEVRLPESDPQAAWKALARLERDQKLLDRNVRVIDLRVPDRMFIKTLPAPLSPAAASGARET